MRRVPGTAWWIGCVLLAACPGGPTPGPTGDAAPDAESWPDAAGAEESLSPGEVADSGGSDGGPVSPEVAADAGGDGGPETATPDIALDAPPLEGPGLGIDYGTTAPGATPRFDWAASDWMAVGWPSDRYRTEEGGVDLSALPNPLELVLLDEYLALGMETLDGFGLNGCAFFQLDAPLDVETLPEPADSQEATSPIQLVNVTPESPRFGERLPLRFGFYDEGADPYTMPRTLSMRPVFGRPMAEGETYCAILTRAVKDAEGRYLQAAPWFVQALEIDPVLAPLLAWLPASQLAKADLAVATCFTTQRATRELRLIHAFLATQEPPTLVTLEEPRVYGEFHGTYVAPNFQAGEKPYQAGGDLQFDASDNPIVQAQEEIRAMLLHPRDQPMPDTGWPVVLYAHGTGGDYESCRGVADELLSLGLAVVCIDQPLHGSRAPDPEAPLSEAELVSYSFNFINARAGRAMFRQAAIDTLTLARMVALGRFDRSEDQTLTGGPMTLDPDRVYFYGHSHGGLSGALVLGIEQTIKAGVLSGAAGVLVETILRRKDPLDIAALVSAALSIPEEHLDTFHPLLSVIQMLVDVTDPVNYSPYWLHPAPGGAAKHVFVTEGTADSASPAVGTDAMAAAAGVPMLRTVAKVSEAHGLQGLAELDPPVSLNVETTDGPRTAGIKQWQGGSHFVATQSAEAVAMWMTFFETLVAGDSVTIGVGDATLYAKPAVAPADACPAASPILGADLPVEVTGDTSLASDDYASGGCGGDFGAGRRDLVYAFTPDLAGSYRLTLRHHAPVDPNNDKVLPVGPNRLYVVTDCAAVGASCVGALAGFNPSDSGGNLIDLGLVAGTTYYAIVDGAGLGDKGAFTLGIRRNCADLECGDRECGSWGCGNCGSCGAGEVCQDGQCAVVALGDRCDAPFVLGASGVAAGTTSGLAGDYGIEKNACPGGKEKLGGGSADAVHVFTANQGGLYDVVLDAEFDAVVYVTTGTCADLAASCLGAHRNKSGREKLQLALESGQTVYVFVDGASNSSDSKGYYSLRVAPCVPECEGKTCSDDGCGGSCGACQAGEHCLTEEGCVPIAYDCHATAACDVIPPGDECALALPADAVPFTGKGNTKDLFPKHAMSSGQCAGMGAAGGSSPEAVYYFTPPKTGLYDIKLDASFDSSLYLFTECADPGGSCLAGQENTDKGNERIWRTLEAGEAFYVAVDGRSSKDHAGPYTLTIKQCTPSCDGKVCGSDGCNGSCGGCGEGTKCSSFQCVTMLGYGCENPITIGGVPWAHENSTDNYGKFFDNACQEPATGSGARDVLYRFTPPETKSYRFWLEADFAAQVYVTTECPSADGATCKAGPGASWLDVELEAGVPVFVLVDGASGSSHGWYKLHVEATCFPSCQGEDPLGPPKECGWDGCGWVCGFCTAPADVCGADGHCVDPAGIAGNSCASAFPIDAAALPFVAEGDTSDAFNHYGIDEGHCPPGLSAKGLGSPEEVWLFTAPEAGTYHVELAAAGFDATLYAATDCADLEHTCLGADDTPYDEALALDLAAGESVYLLVDGASTTAADAGPYQLIVSKP